MLKKSKGAMPGDCYSCAVVENAFNGPIPETYLNGIFSMDYANGDTLFQLCIPTPANVILILRVSEGPDLPSG